jgi:hypothetical protein
LPLLNPLNLFFLHHLSLQLAVQSLPDAPATEVRPEEKVNAPADTEAVEDIDEVIELPDVPSKAPQRSEAPEKMKGIDFMFYAFTFNAFAQEEKSILISLVQFFHCIDGILWIEQFWKSPFLHSGWN